MQGEQFTTIITTTVKNNNQCSSCGLAKYSKFTGTASRVHNGSSRRRRSSPGAIKTTNNNNGITRVPQQQHNPSFGRAGARELQCSQPLSQRCAEGLTVMGRSPCLIGAAHEVTSSYSLTRPMGPTVRYRWRVKIDWGTMKISWGWTKTKSSVSSFGYTHFSSQFVLK